MARLDAHRLGRRLAELVATYDVPGASVAVLADGEVVEAAAGVVNLRTGVATTPDSPFQVQSVTKLWTATLVLQLVDEGRISLDDPVRRHLPRFRTADEEQSAAITVRHLLTHTGGFEGDLWPEVRDDRRRLGEFVDKHVANAPQHLPPGHLYSYCSAGMGVLGRLVEVTLGLSYDEALRRRLAEPLGVRGLAVDAGEALAHRSAIGHVDARAGQPARPLRTWSQMPASNPAAGNSLAMPAGGLLALARMHLGDGIGPGGKPLLSRDSARLMRTAHVPVPASAGAQQGLGWRLPVPGVAEHGGDAIGCGAMLRTVPDAGVAVAVLVNGGQMSALISTLCAELLDGVAELPPPPRVPAGTGADPASYVGTYALRNEVSEITTDDAGRLWLTRTERDEAVTMARRAGAVLEPVTHELRRLEGEQLVRVDANGDAAGRVELVEGGRFLHSGRAAPRV